MIARLAGLDDKGRAEVLLEIMGTERRVVVPRGDLLPLSA